MWKKRKMNLVIGAIISMVVLGFISVTFAVKKPTVVVVLKKGDSQYWKIMKAGMEKGFKDFGIDGKVIVPNDSTTKKQSQLLIRTYKEKPDVIITAPISSSVSPTLETFTDVPILLVDTDLPIKNKTAYIGTNNLDLGKKAGAFLASQLQPGNKIAILGGDLTFPVFRERINGATISLKNAGIKIASIKTGIPDDPETIQHEIIKLMHDQPDIKGIVTTHDTIALAVIKELEEQGLLIPVIGPDGLTDMVEFIADGTVPGTMAQNPYDMGYLSVETAMKVAKGQNVDKFVDSGVDIIIKENAHDRLDFYKKIVE
ncbi:sugar ABC transporter substrate-binding protein [Neobacillus drentensis]|uniref:sugar ABC transporter substrate-binding protein n=1 Tax=Neobacillus drentensis TaxID=220684 RepID=UPI0028607AD1|nr:substrate-binding domain-containing protein [Neobacillus drentensis]MDR7236517.1 ribose transport system substrate-binding protein [Neobacillus drentensis]